MGLKPLHFVQGLSRTPLLFIPRYLTNILFKHILQKIYILRIENLKIWKSKNPGSLTSAQTKLVPTPPHPTTSVFSPINTPRKLKHFWLDRSRLFFGARLFQLLRFSDVRFWKIYLKNKLVLKYRRKNDKGVLGRPRTKRRVLRAISSTLKFQYFRKSWNLPCPTSGKTRSGERSREKFRMFRALLPDTPRPPQFHLKLLFVWKNLVRIALVYLD